MGRWEPNAPGRLGRAAMELYLERGFDQTTVADIAERAGLTERTFFRHFADKREVLFGNQQILHDIITNAIAEADDSAPPIAAMGAGLEAVAELIGQRRDFAQQRQSVIAANPALQERELTKLAALAASSAQALRLRGVPEPTAGLTAEAGIAVFKIAYTTWAESPPDRSLAEFIRETLAELEAVATGTAVQ
ncbi:TetR family transcriptional regulator [Nocardia sp. NPDC059239]|uniref:TetR family transcriptional regulator n=1 Tax=unclassified Nocardia TaxID=2637762 RepID=UPI003682C552